MNVNQSRVSSLDKVDFKLRTIIEVTGQTQLKKNVHKKFIKRVYNTILWYACPTMYMECIVHSF